MMIFKKCLLIFCIALTQALNKDSIIPTTDVRIKQTGYPCEKHSVVSVDGYVLQLFRIPRKLNSTGAVVLLLHPMGGSSDSWVLQENGKDLVYMLHDSGYDVWMGNNRGNYYSRNHTLISPSKLKFWMFGFHELGRFDNAAFIDYILEETGHESLVHIGHSTGSTNYFVLLGSTLPKYNRKISLHIGLAPIVLSDPKNYSPGKKYLIGALRKFLDGFTLDKRYEIFPRVSWKGELAKIFCSEESPIQEICANMALFWSGASNNRLSKRTISRILSSHPAGISVFMALQLWQNIKGGTFQQLDWGEEENLNRYWTKEPPKYDLSRATAPVAFYYSQDDYIANASDVELTIRHLPNVVHTKRVSHFNNIDFLWASNAREVMYNDILQLMQNRSLHLEDLKFRRNSTLDDF